MREELRANEGGVVGKLRWREGKEGGRKLREGEGRREGGSERGREGGREESQREGEGGREEAQRGGEKEGGRER